MEIINLNGIEYIKRDRIKEIEKERDEALLKLKTIENIIHNSNETESPKKSSTYNKTNEPYSIPQSAKMLWDIRFMNDFGQFFNKDNRKLKINIKHVLEMQKTLSKTTTNGDVKELGKKIGLDYQMLHRLAFNYKEGIFDKFIKQWNQSTAPVQSRKNLPVQNNPEKRKEAGIYGI